MTASRTAVRTIRWGDERLTLELAVHAGAPVTSERLFAGPDTGGADRAPGVPLVQLSYDGEGRVEESPSAQHLCKAGTSRLRHVSHEAQGDRLTVVQRDAARELTVTTVLERVVPGCLRTWTEVANEGAAPALLDHVSSLCVTNLARGRRGEFAATTTVSYAHNAWATELRWRRATCEEVGLVDMGSAAPGRWLRTTRARFAVHSTGSWSSGDFLPMGALEDGATGQCWVWQVESNAAWHWELGDHWGNLYLLASGPTDQEHQWRHRLEPGATFVTVPAAIAVSSDGFEGAIAELTRYRRAIRRPNADDRDLPVVFNDYMNCLMGDPTTERLLPLVDAAAAAGAEYFVVDAGWYAGDELWWDSVGEWEPSPTRFPGGLGEVVERIRARGMRPGLWLEPEMVGVESPVAASLPESAFFRRDGRRVAENGRHQLDLRDAAARAHLDGVVDRLIAEFGIEYFKFDYNVNIGVGTEAGAASPGDGLLGHNRAYLAWLDDLFARHPDLVIENCAAGGMRMDYAQLSRLSIQSTSDQQDPVLYAPIAAAAPAALTPEQSAIWAYPQPDYDDELNAFTMVNALLQRVHLSGRLDLMDERQLGRVRAAIDVYKAIRPTIAAAVPHWPLGLPGWSDGVIACALEAEDTALLAVWRRHGAPPRATLELPWWTGGEPAVELLHPADLPCHWTWDAAARRLAVHLPETPSARLLRLTHGTTTTRRSTTHA